MFRNLLIFGGLPTREPAAVARADEQGDSILLGGPQEPVADRGVPQRAGGADAARGRGGPAGAGPGRLAVLARRALRQQRPSVASHAAHDAVSVQRGAVHGKAGAAMMFSSVQFKLGAKRPGKPTCAPSRPSEFSSLSTLIEKKKKQKKPPVIYTD